MILKKYTGQSMSEALARVERDAGRDALIVDTSNEGGVATVIVRKAEPPAPATFKPEPPRLRGIAPGVRPLATELLDRGLSERLVRILFRAVEGLDPHLFAKGAPALRGVVRKVLAGLIPAAAPSGARAIALVGPTGVGKTTTLAKLAARAALEQGRRTGIITTDTFRIAAVEQLRAFADMMDLPFAVAFTPQDLRKTLLRFADLDRVYVDTSGRSPKDRAALSVMRGLFKAVEVEVHLCIQAAARRRDIDPTLQAFGSFEPSALVVTKWDETDAPGEVIAAAVERGLRLSFVADGQRVPEDLWPADVRRIAMCFVEEE